ncbi:hypothetical protein NEF87_004330 [Candidatus Lokiarchaeum ossiferum]|uniref:Class I SAM-dependent methyltransferase n=1 Tax=Candidatus Lokiarchaeum ossiferum TaxID=2951803 RepID=A0ABY6HX06_9ARCH|nr:hypothetical protein NEF87_004330 [Candidatus Lokiarchaeum sp. B-35]
MKITKCRVCKNDNFHQILDLGETPLANAFIEKKSKKKEHFYPLNVVWCDKCGLLMIDEVVPPEIMFKNYIYVSGTSPTLKKHFGDLARDAISTYNVKPGELVVDIASNDGTLLKEFKNQGLSVQGIDPAENISEIARNSGIPTETDFINEKVALKVKKNIGAAKLITATNVVAHINDLDELFRSIKIMLQPDGIFIIEVPYMVDLIENVEFDTIYHEHLSYFAVGPIKILFDNNDFKLIRVKHVSIHGGTIRLFGARKNSSLNIDKSVEEFLIREESMNVNKIEYYKNFALKVENLKVNLLKTLKDIKENGKKIAGYGASAKGNTLLNYFGIDNLTLEYIGDLNKLKQNQITPGTHIPVVNPILIKENQIDYLLILAWNFKTEIMKQQNYIREWGGKFIIPIPQVEIL